MVTCSIGLEAMGRRSGYEYRYGFSIDDEIIPLYPSLLGLMVTDLMKTYVFEIRTNFKLKRVDDGGETTMTMGSERFGVGLWERDDGPYLKDKLSFRLKDDYRMSDDEIHSLARDAFDFAKKKAAADESSVIPVVVELDVWTVQQGGESTDMVMDRAIRLECMIPLYVWSVTPEHPDGVTMRMQLREMAYLRRKSFLEYLPRIRVEDDAGLALMKTCPVCSRDNVVGAQISSLPCNHACHSLCVFQWLRKSNSSCPLCGVRIPADFELI